MLEVLVGTPPRAVVRGPCGNILRCRQTADPPTITILFHSPRLRACTCHRPPCAPGASQLPFGQTWPVAGAEVSASIMYVRCPACVPRAHPTACQLESPVTSQPTVLRRLSMPTLTACNDWCALRLTATASSTAPHPSLPRLPHDLPTLSSPFV